MTRPPRPSARIATIGRYAVLVAAAAVVVLPLYWGLNTALKPDENIVLSPPQWFPDPATLAHFTEVWSVTGLPRHLANTFVIAAGTCLATLLVATHAAYASVRFSFRGRNLGLFVMLASVMIPGIVTLLPQYMIAARAGLVDTRTLLVIVYTAWQIPLSVWVLRAFFQRVPRELDEAAQVDGCSRLGAFYRVVIPVSWPGIAASAIVVAVWVWNEFLIALTLTSTERAQPITVGLYRFVSDTGVQWGRMAAGAAIALIPVVVVFVVLQRRFIEGLTAGAGK
jgi:ABC-type glycerol-3-phosphate transport system permease component